MKTIFGLLLTALIVSVGAVTFATEGMMHHPATNQTAVSQLPPLPAGVVDVNNKTCPISGDKVDNKSFVIYQGKRYRLCCKSCAKMFLKNPEKYIKKLKEREGV